MGRLFRFCYLFSLSLWIGGISIFTFVVTPAIFRFYGRDTAGEIVGTLFPGYFLFLLILSLAAVLFYILPWQDSTRKAFKTSLVLLTVAVTINLYVSFRLHPEMQRIKQEIHSLENAEQESPERQAFRALHAVSAILNLALLADGTTLLFIGTSLKQPRS